MKYKRIYNNQIVVPTKTLKGVKRLLKNGKTNVGTFKCVCPSGNIHMWSVNTTTFVAKGKNKKSGDKTLINYTFSKS